MKEDLKRKNVLDLHFQKSLSISSNAIIISFTFFIAIIIAIVTDQVDFNDYFKVGALLILAILVFVTALIFFISSKKRMKEIVKEIKKL
jgi:Mn2+/Fe2+ NRAMP family transporter